MLSGHFSTFSLVFFVLKSHLGTAKQWSRFEHKASEWESC